MSPIATSRLGEMVRKGSQCLTLFVETALSRSLEPVRLARAARALQEMDGGGDVLDWARVVDGLLQSQRPDGGWSDPEETAWAADVIRIVLSEHSREYQAAVKWLGQVRHSSGGWGKHSRDQARIPVSGLIAAMLPGVATAGDLAWLEAEWRRDFHGPVRLSYKGGFYLLAMAGRSESTLIRDTRDFLWGEQNDDGGFGPWKGHPIGSEPWSTGVVLWGLSQWPRAGDRALWEQAAQWLCITQLPSGCWSYHFLDDGTSLALIGAVHALRRLSTCVPS